MQRPLAFLRPLTHPRLRVLTSFRTPTNKAVQCFSCWGRIHYAFKCPHRTLALEHEPTDCEEEIVKPEGGYEDLVDVE